MRTSTLAGRFRSPAPKALHSCPWGQSPATAPAPHTPAHHHHKSTHTSTFNTYRHRQAPPRRCWSPHHRQHPAYHTKSYFSGRALTQACQKTMHKDIFAACARKYGAVSAGQCLMQCVQQAGDLLRTSTVSAKGSSFFMGSTTAIAIKYV